MSETPQPPFKHERFPSDLEDPFRIVTVHKAKDSHDPISCTIRNAQLKDNEAYFAISHAWGSLRNPPKKPVTVNDKRFEIVESAWCLLKRLRDSSRDESGNPVDVDVWIDLLCIDQGRDDEAKKEKSQQVSIMGEIYKNSTMGVIWLGEPGDVGEKGTSPSESAKNAASVLEEFRKGTKFKEMKYFKLNEGRVEVKEDSKSLFAALLELLNVTWWTRIWVIQEVVLPKDIEFRYADQVLTYEMLKAVTKALTGEDEKNKDFRNRCLGEAFDPLMVFEEIVVPMITTREEYHQSDENKKNLTLSELRKRFAASDASWKQDLFYGLLGMVHWDSAEQRLKPDYTLPAALAIRKAVEHCLKDDKNLNFLYGLRRRNDYMSGDPSWLPDFHVQPTPSRIAWGEQNRFRIAKHLSGHEVPGGDACPRLLDHGCLVLQAVRVDTVAHVGSVCDPLNKKGEVPGILEEWMEITLGKDNEWPDFDKLSTAQDAFWKTIINNCVPAGNSYASPAEQHYGQIKLLWGLLKFDGGPSSGATTSDGNSNPQQSANDVVKRLEDSVFKHTSALAYHFLVCLWKRRMIKTANNLIGLAPEAAQKDDQIWVPLGSSVAFIIRPCCDGTAYSVIGNPYVHRLNAASSEAGKKGELVLH